MPKVSVVMTVYNGGEYLSESIKSILNQTLNDFEFIIINDGSNDSTKEIIKSFKDSRIKYVENLENLGIVDSANIGINLSIGKYIARMDSDDISSMNRLEIQYNFLEENTHIFLVASSFSYVKETGEVMSNYIKELNSEDVKKMFPKENPIHQPTVMFRNEANIYYRKKAIYCEDRDLWFRLSQLDKKFYVLPDVLLQYRVHSSSVSNSKKRIQDRMIKVVNKWYYEREKIGVDSYDNFNVDEYIAKIQEVTGFYAETKAIKFLFKESDNMIEVRTRIRMFWSDFGISSWPASFVYFLISYSPSILITIFRKIIWSKY